jgi:FRG domain
MPAEAPLPGTHQIEPQEIVTRSCAEFRRAVRQLRKRFPIVTSNQMYREHDRQAFGTDMPVIYELVFRGQTKEYIDRQSARPLLLPNAFRPGVKPAWIDKGPPGLFGNIREGLLALKGQWKERARQAIPRFVFGDIDEKFVLRPKPRLTKDDIAQYKASQEGLINYSLQIVGVENPDAFREKLSQDPNLWTPLPGSDLESVLNAIYSYSSTKHHRCILGQYDIPPFPLLMRDLGRFHDLGRYQNRFILPATPGLAGQNFVESLKTMYVYAFLRANSNYLPVLTAILQHYGLPTRALDVTLDPNVALWFACHRAEKVEGELHYTRSPESGYVYVLWIPVTIAANGGRSYRQAQRRGHRHGVKTVSSPLELALLVDLSASMTMIERDVRTRAVRQRAALLLGNINRPDWAVNASAEYLVGKIIVGPQVLRGLDVKAWKEKYRTSFLFPSPSEDRLLSALLKAGVKGLEIPSSASLE